MTTQARLERAMDYYIKRKLHDVIFDDEGTFQKYAIDFLELAGAVVIREATATKRGVADLLACFNGRFIALELKDKDGVPSAQQLKFLEKIHEAGGSGMVCSSLYDIYHCLHAALRSI